MPILEGKEVVKNSPAKAGDASSISVSGSYTGEGKGNPLQYSCLENPMDRGTWQATVHGVAIVSHNLATKPPPHSLIYCIRTFFGKTLW